MVGMPMRSRYGRYLPSLYLTLSTMLARTMVRGIFVMTEMRYITYMCMGWMPMVLPMITLVVDSSSACAIVKTEYAPKPPTEYAMISRKVMYLPSGGFFQ